MCSINTHIISEQQIVMNPDSPPPEYEVSMHHTGRQLILNFVVRHTGFINDCYY